MQRYSGCGRFLGGMVRALQSDGAGLRTRRRRVRTRASLSDTEAEAELAARYDIRSIPTLMLFHKGNIVAQRAGAVGVEALRDWLRRHAPSTATAAS
jgi:hypothetical protein